VSKAAPTLGRIKRLRKMPIGHLRTILKIGVEMRVVKLVLFVVAVYSAYMALITFPN
jgi:hypothetical protein